MPSDVEASDVVNRATGDKQIHREDEEGIGKCENDLQDGGSGLERRAPG